MSEAVVDFSLQRQLLTVLDGVSMELQHIAQRLGLPAARVDAELRRMGEAGLVDALEPPPPCGRLQMRWFKVGHVFKRAYAHG